ncbi:hypothetical protein [Promicromonospora sp. NPDC060271]|uniref:DUF6414 family protein n=1 Tax=Promicromonospora sp. NPDC060271 TaxID=3347089 RepID=UPI00365161D8
MLRRFIYLNSTAVRQYTSMIDNGLADTSVSVRKTGRTTAGGADLKVLRGDHSRNAEDENSTTRIDTDEARFDRLVQAAATTPDELGWVEVVDPDTDLEDIGIGAIISWECEIFVPQVAQMLSPSSGLGDALAMIKAFAPAARAMGHEVADLPNEDEVDALQRFTQASAGKLVLVGDDDSTDWKVTGALEGDFIGGEVEGRAIVVGKVKKVLRVGSWQAILAMPGLNLLSREERRAQERRAPEADEEENYVAGPALVLDILAVYI